MTIEHNLTKIYKRGEIQKGTSAYSSLCVSRQVSNKFSAAKKLLD